MLFDIKLYRKATVTKADQHQQQTSGPVERQPGKSSLRCGYSLTQEARTYSGVKPIHTVNGKTGPIDAKK